MAGVLPTDTPGRWYRIEEVAEALQIPFYSLADAVTEGKCEHVQFPGTGGYRVQLAAVQEWMARQVVKVKE